VNIKFLSVEASNFRSFEHFKLDLSKGGITLVQGKIEGGSETLESNGAGKSSIFSAISWALFGKFPHVSGSKVSGDKVVRRGSSGGCLVAVKFQAGGRAIEVTRFRLHTLHGDKLVLRVDDKEVTQATNQKTQLEVEALLGISFELFVNLIFVTEATIKESFAFETDANRKKMLVSALPQFQKFGKARVRVKDSLAQFSGYSNKLQTERNAFATAFKEMQSEVIPNTFQINNRITQLRNEIAALTKSVQDNKAESVDASFHLSSLDGDSTDTEFDELMKVIEGKQHELSTFNFQKNTAESGFQKWDKMGAACPTCGQSISHSEKIQHVQTFKEEMGELGLHAEALCLELLDLQKEKQKLEARKAEIRKLRGLIQSRKEVSERAIQSDTAAIEAKNAEIDQLNLILKNLDEVKELSVKQKDTIQNKIIEIDQLLSVVKNFECSLSVWLDGYGPRGVLSIALSHVVDVLTQKTKKWLESLWHEGASLSFDFTGEDFSKIESQLFVNQRVVDLGSLSSGETRRLCLSLCFGLREALQELTGWKSSLLILDEVFDGLDGVGRIKVLSELKQLEDTSVFVISQFPQLSEDIDRVARVRFSNNVSALEILHER
jgi:DNA repair exonuclease SbcCD ATPase subunit